MRVGICCRQGLFCEALGSLLDSSGDYQVVASEHSTRDLIAAAKEHRANLLVVDTVELDQSELQFLLGARAFGDFGVVLIAAEDEIERYAGLAVDHVVSRNSPAQTLFEALSEVGSKLKAAYPFVRERKRAYGRVGGTDLSRREFEVAQLVAKGMSNRRIAQVTGLQEQSIKNLVSVIMRKLGCENRVQVALRLTQSATRIREEATPVEV